MPKLAGPPPQADPPFVGDHLAMDLLNTQARVEGVEIDAWASGADVLRWLARQGIAPAPGAGRVDETELLARAVDLRAQARRLIVARTQGSAGDPAGLNAHLHACPATSSLQRDDASGFVLVRSARGDAIARLLLPVAEAVAELLAEADFSLVRQCEHPDCVLWFFDRTKSHRRRWCSMAVCGNRHKAARFRASRRDGAAG
ncbi:CGNR zinc finger domain-containing protein [Luteimonas sp. M1R5S18]|jgi:predicted RNA-binding Zn ribbon-like protein|uniref:CGNR zinc finger domain-containing protein n=1 Tax=Luteimonas rhizosphaericola TaxID=3042024 RepID=A0ABT6JLZ3_9GAMM|nr:ABATE domain-containing protein [Luteimonas rhizosphaericola]MDH5831667.1 CGNR zinc finger domain-containing protein [Luteimonas rhizosphaericola]